MDDRKYYILGAILRSYIKSNEPIGSRTLQRDFNMKVSAATIRNEMSDLEHLGYLMKAHTSSGRIPSERAYRWYVDELQSRGFPMSEVQALPNESTVEQSLEFDSVIDRALQVLVDSSNYPAVALIPGRTDDKLRKLQLIPLSETELVFVMIYDTKVVQTDLVYLKNKYSKERIERTSDILNEILEGKKLKEIDEYLHSPMFSQMRNSTNLISEIIPLVRRNVRKDLDPKLIFKGLSNMYELNDFGSFERTSEFIEKLKDNEELIALAQKDKSGNVEVYIGNESNIEALEDSTLILSPYYINGKILGKIGILGPIRMEYHKALLNVQMMAHYVDRVASR